MKRGELKRNPEGQRAWEERSRDAALERAQTREGARSTQLRRTTALPQSSKPLARRPRKTVHVPYGPKNEARRRSGGRCVVCGGKRRGFMQFHHVLPRRLFPALIQLADNLVLVCASCHDRHERAFRRIKRHELPECCLALAARVGSTAVAYIERTYPDDESAEAGRHPASEAEEAPSG